jgi:4-amino-4-deoxy-L-arabinose transferase-like glycosyltransferase
MLVLSGIRYMLSESFTDKDKAKKRISSSLWGLLLLASSWLILYVINPQLLNFKIAHIRPTQTIGTPAATAPNTQENLGRVTVKTQQDAQSCINSGGTYVANSSETGHNCQR